MCSVCSVNTPPTNVHWHHTRALEHLHRVGEGGAGALQQVDGDAPLVLRTEATHRRRNQIRRAERRRGVGATGELGDAGGRLVV